MKIFMFELMINGFVCEGMFEHDGKNEADAYNKAQEEIDAIVRKLPVEVQYSIGVV